MSERKEGPDGPGRWYVKRKFGHGEYFLFVSRDGELVTPQHGFPASRFVKDGDSWHRVYVPGLDDDNPSNPVCYTRDYAKVEQALTRAGVFKQDRSTADDIDALAAQRDETRQEVERLTRERDDWHSCATEHAEKLGDLCNTIHSRCDELGISPDDADVRVQRLANALATLRQQQGKGEWDKPKEHYRQVTLADTPGVVGELFGELTAHDPAAAHGLAVVLHHVAIGALSKKQEASRAT